MKWTSSHDDIFQLWGETWGRDEILHVVQKRGE